MAGIVQSAMPRGGALKITPQSVEQGMHLRPQQRMQLKRIVIAGMKVMFSQQSHHMLTDQLSAPGDMATKLGQGVAGLMGLLMRESNNSLPPNLIIPAALILLAHAAEYVQQTGGAGAINDQVVGNAMQVCLHAIMTAFHLDPNKVAAIGAAGKGGAAAPPPGAAAPAAPGAAAPAGVSPANPQGAMQ